MLACLLFLGFLNPLSSLNFFLPQVYGSNTLFSDGFESYAVGANNSRANPCISPPDDSATCEAPPHFNNGPVGLPEYWQLAASGTCATRGGCVTWGNYKQAGPNSIFSVVTERARSGTKSLKLGASDYAFDKSQASVWLDPTALAASGNLNYSQYVMFSNGINTANSSNHFQIWMAGLIIRYVGSTGEWGVLQTLPGGGTQFNFLITHPLTTHAWHRIDVNVDLATKTFSSLVIDGVTQSPSIQGLGAGSWHTVINNQKTVVGIMSWINPGLDNQSIHSLGQIKGYYAYIDDVAISQTPTGTVYSGTTSATPTTLDYQGKVFYANRRFWAAFSDGANLGITNTANGVFWSPEVKIHSPGVT